MNCRIVVVFPDFVMTDEMAEALGGVAMESDEIDEMIARGVDVPEDRVIIGKTFWDVGSRDEAMDMASHELVGFGKKFPDMDNYRVLSVTEVQEDGGDE